MDAIILLIMAIMIALTIKKPGDPHIWPLWGIALVTLVGWWIFHEFATPGVTEVTL
ncbi:hypothetical protein [Streptomyces sp. cg36]|uniref:hypothetical protein n=1 Tax=Streptomyces sp. cg36 TaxID=3238798 RepID=UPI0034E2111A